MRGWIAWLLLLLTPSLFGARVLNVYNWADYMPTSVIKRFEKETGIQLNYTEYDSNETLYAKLKTNPKLGYDVIFPSSYYVQRMRQENMLQKLDKVKLSNFSHLNAELLNQPFDPNNQYSVPYLWGTTAIVVNKKYIDPNKMTKWQDFWAPQYKNQLLMFDDMREVFAIALLKLGYSINDTNKDHIEAAYVQIKALWPNIKLFSLEAEQNIYIDEDAYVGMGLNGEIYNARAENPNLTYVYPAEGFELWMDTIAIPVDAPHLTEAFMFINFLLRPDNAKEIAVSTGFSTPNQTALALLPVAMRTSQILNPPKTVRERGQFLLDLGPTNAIYEAYWNRLKVGD